MIQRTDIPTMYAGEYVFQLDDGTLAVIVLRQVESSSVDYLALAGDCWEVDATGAPTGISTPRLTHTQPLATLGDGDGLRSLDSLVSDLRARAATWLGQRKTLAAQLAGAPLRVVAPSAAPAVDIPHPLTTTPDALAADLAALDTSAAAPSSST